MDYEPQLDNGADARSSFDVQLPIQIHSRPTSIAADPSDDAHDYGSTKKTPNERDEDLITQAQVMGLTVPEAPQESLEAVVPVAHNGSAITITSSQPDSAFLQSRTSNSTRPTSFTSSEPQVEQRNVISTPNTAASIISSSRSTLSTTPRRRANSKLRDSFKRLSILGRKKTSDTIEFVRPSLERNHSSVTVPRRPATADGARSSSLPPVLPPICTSPRRTVGTLLPSFSETRITTSGRITGSNLRPLTPPSEDKEKESDSHETPSARAARERSLHCGRLQRLRISHLDEQSSFLTARRAAFSLIRARHQPTRQKVHEDFANKYAGAVARHVAANADLENRHLTAEMDLERALTSERKACSTKIKYMEAYCYGSRNRNLTSAPLSSADRAKAAEPAPWNMPERKVTEEDYRKLVEQYHLRNGMDQLHAARINVLREQQAKQAERIGRKQEGELARLGQERDRELAKVENEVRRDIASARQEWAMKKRRMVWRWGLKEAIERKTLEMERGEKYGELPEVIWPPEEDQATSIIEETRGNNFERIKRLEMEAGGTAESEAAFQANVMDINLQRQGEVIVGA